ncbi:MAG: cytidylate kinase [Parcubacteria group bacterium ADurb.Bin316]|nr:MAG: cytidylate kinase [Parcubacteria group bacterium ADurb.Bin316]HOZ55629.1 cytidylate kinase family protein [bacterium]
MIISIAGAIGSGKSTIGKILSDKMGWPRYNMGDVWRETARQKGMTLAELQKLSETDFKVDKEVDGYVKKLGATKDNFIIEGRLAWHFIPHSLKIYLDVSEDEAARRIFSELEARNESQEDKKLETYEDVLRSIKSRKERDVYRYQKYYNLNPFNPKNYDLTVDTTNLNIDEVLTEVYEFVKNRLS